MLNQVLMKYLWLLFILKCSEAARILCFQGIPFDSHQAVLHLLTEQLARQGHQLVVLTALPRQDPVANITEIDIHNISYPLWENSYDAATKHRETYAFPDLIEFWDVLGEILGPMYDLQLSHPQTQALLRDNTQRFDLVIVDVDEDIGRLLSARFAAPLLVASATALPGYVISNIGAEDNLLYYPVCISTTGRLWMMSFWEKLRVFCKSTKLQLTMQFGNMDLDDAFVRKQFGEYALSMRDRKRNMEMFFINTYHFWDNNRPAPIGSVLYMGGMHLKPPKSLPEDLNTFVGKSKHGVVLVSLGSRLKSSALPARTLRVMINVFAKLPYDFIWKWDTDEMPNKPSNVRIEKWIPQNDLLHNPSVKALIGHGGMLSMFEAINARVPLISMPVFGDQWLHSSQCETHGIGVRLDIDSLNEEGFRNAIVAVVEDKKYRENIDRLSRILSDRRESPLTAASRLVGHLTTRGASHLRSPRADATFNDLHVLDLLLIATVCGLIVIVAIFVMVKRLVSLAVGKGRYFRNFTNGSNVLFPVSSTRA